MDEDGLVVETETDVNRFKFGRAGDHFMTMFQCDLCHFRNIKKSDPRDNDVMDTCAMRNIRRANLDALWSREPTTVRTNLAQVRKMCAYGEDRLGFETKDVLPVMGPFPVRDDCGMRVAALSTERSLDRGMNEATVQFGTVRRFRSAFSNMWHASVAGGLDAVAVRDTARLTVSSCPTFSDWYERFGLGLHKRMGDHIIQDKAISVEVMVELMRNFEVDWNRSVNLGESDGKLSKILFPALFSVVAYVLGLRGEEVPLMDLSGTLKHFSRAVSMVPDSDGQERAHAVVALLGRFKGEKGEKHHYMVTVLKTKSGLEPAKWIGRALNWYSERGISNGPMFRNKLGARAKVKEFEGPIFDGLYRIQRERPDLIDPLVDVGGEYGMSRSHRRGSDSRAMAERIPEDAINLNNRWRKFEKAKGKRPTLKMTEHYADIQLLLPMFLVYSRSM